VLCLSFRFFTFGLKEHVNSRCCNFATKMLANQEPKANEGSSGSDVMCSA
jgi:hypothetical protein